MPQWQGHGEVEPGWMLDHVLGHGFLIPILASTTLLAQTHVAIQAMMKVQNEGQPLLCA
jgi:hypothetical protein